MVCFVVSLCVVCSVVFLSVVVSSVWGDEPVTGDSEDMVVTVVVGVSENKGVGISRNKGFGVSRNVLGSLEIDVLEF